MSTRCPSLCESWWCYQPSCSKPGNPYK